MFMKLFDRISIALHCIEKNAVLPLIVILR